ncbi:hypothetical protein BdWA1_000257 [Babesia duncani]|uniref:Uncharacterized protein n=1 Tax=Babesia duncani TaxID=323732 RepID=A0AAD9UPN1_9APIC|nr:hypothetical protein BdWA1_000257 [Babesia duncani]
MRTLYWVWVSLALASDCCYAIRIPRGVQRYTPLPVRIACKPKSRHVHAALIPLHWKTRINDAVTDYVIEHSKNFLLDQCKRKLDRFKSIIFNPIDNLFSSIHDSISNILINRKNALETPHALRHKRWLFTYQHKIGIFS